LNSTYSGRLAMPRKSDNIFPSIAVSIGSIPSIYILL
jgi:hypothetical protein